MKRFYTLFVFLAFSHALWSQSVLHAKRILSYQNNSRIVKPAGEGQFILSLGAAYNDTLRYGNKVFVYDTSVSSGTDMFGNHLLIDFEGNYQNHFLSARGIETIPYFTSKGSFLFTGRYPGYASPVRISEYEFEEDTVYARITGNFGTENAYICALDPQLRFIGGVNISTPGRGSIRLKAVSSTSGYYVSGSIASEEMKWDSDSIHVKSFGSYAQSFSFLARLDNDFNVIWRKYIFGLQYPFDPRYKYTYKSAISSGSVLETSDQNLMLFSVHSDGLEFDGDTVIAVEDHRRGQVHALLIDSGGKLIKAFQFRKHLESDHLDAVSNGEGTILHFVRYKESFPHDGTVHAPDYYFIVYDDTLGVKKILPNRYATAVCSASDGSFYWAGNMSPNQSYDFGDIHISASTSNKLILGKISAEGEYLWVKTYNGILGPTSITEHYKKIAITGTLQRTLINDNGDTLLKPAPSPLITGGLVILEDQHILGETEVLSEEARLKVYPNPSNTSFTLEWVFEEAVELSVYDISGRKIFTKTALDQADQLRFSPNNPGVYFIHIQDGKQSLTRKIVKL